MAHRIRLPTATHPSIVFELLEAVLCLFRSDRFLFQVILNFRILS